jgi:hypothetical protein
MMTREGMQRHYLLFAFILFFAPLCQTADAESISVLHRHGNWQIYGDSPYYLDIGIGAFDADEDKSSAARIEFRFGKKYFIFGPTIGLLASNNNVYYGYGGIYADIAYKRLVITPMGGFGGYEEGDARDLGGTFQFRAAITLSYQFDNQFRLGFQAGHISNAGTHNSNPSEQDLLLTLAIPL